jgi:RNA polymerase sigma factor (sigma-70 family)
MRMTLTGLRYDLDLDRLTDEELVVLAQECDYRPAGEALVQRYHDWARWLAARCARRSRLQSADAEDARQNAVLSLAEAIRCYDTLQLGRRGGYQFRAFLVRVVGARYLDFLRRLRRLGQRYKGAAALAEALESAHRGGHALRDGGDPVGAAERQEEQVRLEQALCRMDEVARSLWERLATGTPLRAAAQELGLSYYAAKRARRRLLAALTAQLRQAEKIAPAAPRSSRWNEYLS